MARLEAPACLTLVEVVMPQADLPPLLRKVTACLAQHNGA
nr:indolepyruvate decarboxylase [Candidatus Pantoea persica]